jgi:hypothetical protein
MSMPGTTINAPPSALLLPRLQGVTTTGKGWRAICPACGGKSRKLSISESDNGTLLVHCFAGCAVPDVLAAVGLTTADLFQRRDLRTMSPAQRSEFRQAALIPRWRAALDVLVVETTVVLIAANQLGDGVPLADTDLARVRLSALRAFDAQEVLSHGR